MATAPRLFDSVELLVPLPEEPYAGSACPPKWHGLVVGDSGMVIEVYENPRGYTVEFFRDERTIAIADVTPAQVRVVQRHPANAPPEPAPRIAD